MILDTTIQALEDNPDRKFIYVEMSFFTKWYERLGNDKKMLVRKLVKDNYFIAIVL